MLPGAADLICGAILLQGEAAGDEAAFAFEAIHFGAPMICGLRRWILEPVKG
jgi:hypothetical protein